MSAALTDRRLPAEMQKTITNHKWDGTQPVVSGWWVQMKPLQLSVSNMIHQPFCEQQSSYVTTETSVASLQMWGDIL